MREVIIEFFKEAKTRAEAMTDAGPALSPFEDDERQVAIEEIIENLQEDMGLSLKEEWQTRNKLNQLTPAEVIFVLGLLTGEIRLGPQCSLRLFKTRNPTPEQILNMLKKGGIEVLPSPEKDESLFF